VGQLQNLPLAPSALSPPAKQIADLLAWLESAEAAAAPAELILSPKLLSLGSSPEEAATFVSKARELAGFFCGQARNVAALAFVRQAQVLLAHIWPAASGQNSQPVAPAAAAAAAAAATATARASPQQLAACSAHSSSYLSKPALQAKHRRNPISR